MALSKAAQPKKLKPELSEEQVIFFLSRKIYLYLQRQEVKEAFDLFDTDKSGSIDYHGLVHLTNPIYI